MKTFENVEQIKTERQAQRDNPVIYSLLGVVLGELDRLPTRANPTEDQIYTVIKKMYEGAELLVSKDWDEEAKIEYAYLKDFIKQQLSENDVRYLIASFVDNTDNCNIGLVMKYFKDNYPGQYDGKSVSQIAKQILG